MKRFLAFFVAVLLFFGAATVPASAAGTDNAASRVDLLCTVNSDGSCQVKMTVVLRISQPVDRLVFPLPVDAKNISMNGSPVNANRGFSSTDVDISRLTRDYLGEIVMYFDYTLENAVRVDAEVWKEKNKKLLMEIPLLCGFDYAVEYLSFTVNMPGSNFVEQPEYTSIYSQSSIASNLHSQINGSQIIGSSKMPLNDHEGITMTMLMSQEMFPTVSTYLREGNPELLPLLILAGIALLYWLVCLFNKPLTPSRTSTPPSGITAGEMGCRLTLAGGDLTMMVFTWAQLGYLLIRQESDGRVLLHKRMDMGNERSVYENKVFNTLFGNRRTVDATGDHYARYCHSLITQISSEKTMYKGNSGNMRLFRWIACASHVCAGVNVAMNMGANLALQIIMAVILGIFAAVSAWLIQGIAYRTHLRGKTPVYMGLVCILLWILLGVFSGMVWIPLGSALGQWVFGYLAAYGGRRSDMGRREAGLVLGFRKYVKRLPSEDVSRLMSNDPDYFFNLAPYALALGVIHPFASAFGGRKLNPCPYLLTKDTGKHTAGEWAKVLVQTADRMDSKSRRLQVERWLNIQLTLPTAPAPRRRPRNGRPQNKRGDRRR